MDARRTLLVVLSLVVGILVSEVFLYLDSLTALQYYSVWLLSVF